MADTTPEIFSGRISTVTYDDGAGFRIVKVSLDTTGTLITAKGHFVGQNITPGTWVCFEGEHTVHPTYGKQVSVTRSPVIPERWNDQRVLSILTAQGIGPGVRTTLVDYAAGTGKSILETLESGSLPGDLAHAGERWKAAKAHLYAAAFLASAGIPGPVIDRVWKKFSTDVEQIVTKDPWVLVQVEGITFAQADEVATKLGIPLTAPQRISGAVMSVMKSASTEGHLYATMGGILEAVLPIVPNATDQSVAQAVKSLVLEGALILDRATKPGVVAIYDPAVYTVEATSADMLIARLSVAQTKDLRPNFARIGPKATAAINSDLKTVVLEALSDWTAGSGISLTEDQIRAAQSALTDNVSLVTGLPGTGKTTALRAVVSCLKDAGVGFLLVAPTGIAAKRLSNVVNAPAFTIHRAFGAKGRYGEDDGREVAYEGFLGESDAVKKTNVGGLDETWGFGPGNPHPADVVVVDETSMVDMHMLHRILGGTRPDCRLVFVGDPYQLPSVGAGDVLGDLVESKVFPHTHLDRIFRQEDTSGIVLAAHAVHKGFTPESDGRDFVIVPAATEVEASELVLRLTKTLYDKRANFQVLSPRHSGEAGVTNLNDRIRSQLNPPQTGMAETRIGGSVVREGDRIMVVRNDYQKGVYNGDVGTVRRIDRTTKEIETSVFGLPGTPSALVRFPMKDAARTLRLAYAQTVHKCVHPDTLVWHNGGIYAAGEIPASGEIATPDGVRKYQDKVTYPTGDLLKITTVAGYSIRVTPEHGLDVWDRGAGRYVRKEAQDVTLGDWLCLVPQPTTPQEPGLLPLVGIKYNAKYPRLKIQHPSHLDEDVAEFVGMLAALAAIRHSGMQINFKRWDRIRRNGFGRADIGESINRFCSLCYKIFRKNPKKLFHDRWPHLLKFKFKLVIEWFWKNFPELFRSRGYRVPKLILASNRSVRRAFLRGYFLQAQSQHEDPTDPTSPLDSLCVRPRSPEASEALRALLLDEGIICHGNLVIRGRDLPRFFAKIGFAHPDANRLALLPHTDYSDDNRVPLTADEAYAVFAHRGFQSVPVDRIVQYDPSLANKTRFFHNPVKSIELVQGPSVCVTVPETHRFIQNGFCGWNSQGQEYDVIIVPMLASFGRQLQRNLLYTAITRARKKVLIIGQASAVAKAVQNDSAEHRRTLLAARLRGGSVAAKV